MYYRSEQEPDSTEGHKLPNFYLGKLLYNIGKIEVYVLPLGVAGRTYWPLLMLICYPRVLKFCMRSKLTNKVKNEREKIKEYTTVSETLCFGEEEKIK